MEIRGSHRGLNAAAPPRGSLSLLIMLLCPLALHAQSPTPARAQSRERGLEQELSRRPAQPPAETVTLPGKPKRFALVIGVDRYSDAQVAPLGGASNDARVLADALTRYAGFPADQVVLLASDQPAERQPTRGNILRRLSNLAAVVPKDGLLLFSFAGHGVERREQAFLLPSDAQVSDDVNLLEQTAINVVQIKHWIRTTGVQQVLLLLDACRNDPSAGRASADNPLSKAYTRGFNFDVRNREVTAFATLYATEIGRRAYEFQEKRHGYFTWALVEGLRGKAANDKGEVTLAGLVKYLQETVPRRVLLDLGHGRVQRPFAVIEGYRADALVLATKGAQPAASSHGFSDERKQVQPSAAPQDAPAASRPGGEHTAGGLAGTTWTGNSPEAGEYTIEFLGDGRLRYLITVLQNGKKSQRAVNGTWKQSGASVQIVIGNSYSVLNGTLEGDLMRGTGVNAEGTKWDWVLLRKAQ